jgi:AraC-like DNA-binding protein
MSDARMTASDSLFWRDTALPFIEARFVQDGRQVCYARHWHETFSIGLISQGRCKYANRTQAVEACAGTLVLMNPGDAHACNPIRGESWSYKMLYVDVPWLCTTQDQADAGTGRPFEPFSAIATTQTDLYDALNGLFETLVDPRMEDLAKQSAAVSFLRTIRLRLGSLKPARRETYPNLTRAAEFIRQNCTRSLRLEEICAEVGLSASHLIRAFKHAYGLTPHIYQLNCRIEFCRSRLRAGHSIADVALAAGFSDQAHLQRSFKRFVAATPGQYRG